MGRQFCRYALGFVAGESGSDQSEGVASIEIRAGWAARGSTVLAGDEHKAARFLVAAVALEDLARVTIERDPFADQAYRCRTVVRPAELFEDGRRSLPIACQGHDSGALLANAVGVSQRARIGERAGRLVPAVARPPRRSAIFGSD